MTASCSRGRRCPPWHQRLIWHPIWSILFSIYIHSVRTETYLCLCTQTMSAQTHLEYINNVYIWAYSFGRIYSRKKKSFSIHNFGVRAYSYGMHGYFHQSVCTHTFTNVYMIRLYLIFLCTCTIHIYILHSLVATPTCISYDVWCIWPNEEFVCEVCDHTRQYMMVYTLGMRPYMEYMDILMFNI